MFAAGEAQLKSLFLNFGVHNRLEAGGPPLGSFQWHPMIRSMKLISIKNLMIIFIRIRKEN